MTTKEREKSKKWTHQMLKKEKTDSFEMFLQVINLNGSCGEHRTANERRAYKR